MEIDGEGSLAGNLPVEVLEIILDKLSYKDRFSSYEVCQNWRKALDQGVGLILRIGKGMDEIWEEHAADFKKLDTISKYGACTAHFSSIPVDSYDLYKFKYPAILKDLWVDGTMPTRVFNAFAADLTNLRKLTLHVSTLSVSSVDKFALDFPKLSNFNVTMATGEELEYENLTLVADNLEHIMRRGPMYPALKSLKLHYPFIPDRATDVTQAIINFMIRHKAGLHQVMVSAEGSGEIEVLPNGAPGQLTEADLQGFKLSTFNLHCDLADHASMRNLRKILNHQTQAVSLFCTTGYLPLSRFRRTLKASALTLTSIQLAIRGEMDASGVNLDFFSPCKSLRILALLGPEKDENTEDPFEEDEQNIDGRLLTPDFQSVASLPDSIQVLKIFNLFLTSDDVRTVIRKPGLRVLRLENTGRFGNLGLTLPDAFDILGKKVLKTISWKQCINVKSVNEARKGNDPNAFLCALIIRHVEDAGFKAHLNETGRVYDYKGSSKEPEILPSDDRFFNLKNNYFSLTEAEDEEQDDDDDDADADDEEDEDSDSEEEEVEVSDNEEDVDDQDDVDMVEAEEEDDDAEEEEDEDNVEAEVIHELINAMDLDEEEGEEEDEEAEGADGYEDDDDEVEEVDNADEDED